MKKTITVLLFTFFYMGISAQKMYVGKVVAAQTNQTIGNLRVKRYLPTVAPAAPTGNFLDFIFYERSRELCYEGQRWFDLARTGRLINAVKATQLAISTTTAPANIQPKHYLFPLPTNEILNNTAIDFADQNPGW